MKTALFISKPIARMLGYVRGRVGYSCFIIAVKGLCLAARLIPKPLQRDLLGKEIPIPLAFTDCDFKALLKKNLCSMYYPVVDRESFYYNCYLLEEINKMLFPLSQR